MFRRPQVAFLGVSLLLLIAAAADRTIRAGHAAPADENPASGARVRLVDMAKIFKRSNFFNQQREELKEEITAKEAEAKSKANEIKSLQNQLKELEKGSDAYVEVEAELKRHGAEFEEFRKSTQLHMLKIETKIYHQTYQRVDAAVRDYAEEHELDLVLRFNSEELEEENPQKLLQGMARQVIYHRNLDITDEILAMVNDQ